MPVPADAFVDTGADTTIVSLRWTAELGGRDLPHPKLDYDYSIKDDDMSIEIAGRVFSLPRACVYKQGRKPPPKFKRLIEWERWPSMGGYEDILIGKDFFTAHSLFLQVNGADRTFSILYPDDADNQRQRDSAVLALGDECILPTGDVRANESVTSGAASYKKQLKLPL